MAEEQGFTFSKESKGWKEVKVTSFSYRLCSGLEVNRRFDTITDDSFGQSLSELVTGGWRLVTIRREYAGSDHGRGKLLL